MKAAAVFVLLLAALLRFWGLDHGMPRNYVPDTTVVRAALALGRGTNPFRGEPLPTQYPYLLPYGLLGVYGGDFLIGKATGRFETVADFERFAFDHPEHFFLVAQSVVALSGTLMVLLVMLVARMVMDRLAAVCAGFLTATSLILVQLSHQARPHVVGATILVACLWLALRAGQAHSGRCLLGSWVCAGLAGSTVPYGLIGLAIPLAATIGHRVTRRHRAALAAGGVALVAVVVVVCFPRSVLAPAASFSLDATTRDVHYFDGLVVSPSFVNGKGFAKLGGWLVRYEPMLTVLAIVGIGWLIASRRGRDRRAWVIVVYPLLFVIVYGSYEVIHPRYLTSLVPFLSLPAGYLAGALLRRAAPSRLVLGVLAVAMLAPPLTQAIRLDVLLARTDVRLLAEAWIEQHLPRGDKLGIEAHGVEPDPDQESLEEMARAHPAELGIRDRQQLHDRARLSGRRVFRLWYTPRYLQQDVRTQAAEHGLRFVAAVVPGDRPRADRFYRSLRRDGRKLATFSPLSDPDRAAETRLPLELDDPLRDLWRVDRCGPIIEVYEVTPR